MATVCECDKCGAKDARNISIIYDKPGSPPERISVDLCTECIDPIIKPLRQVKNLIGGRMMAAQCQPK